MPSIEERVAEGAQRFDAADQTWAYRVSVTALDTSSYTKCAASQAFGSYRVALALAAIARVDDAWRYGLDIEPNEPHSVYVQLDAAWRAEILKRRK